ncbi:MAG TPA: peptidase S8, partial [Mobilitalea sp.]|nr:peptidase S8 [Mobilitalea sp.]
MDSGILENQLNLALDVPEATREKTSDLDIGYVPETNTWELIVKYNGSLQPISEQLGISIIELSGGYAIVTIPENLIDQFARYEEIEFIEKPKRLFYEVSEGRAASCINPLQTPVFNLFGEGVLVAIIDSGIDYSHPDFRNEDGTSRIITLWDQTIPGNPPEGFQVGSVYSRDQINEALMEPMPERMNIVP